MSTHAHSSSKFLLYFGAFWLLFALPFGFAGIHMLDLEKKFEIEGITVSGTVLGKNIEEKKEWDKNTKSYKTSTSYKVQYKFKSNEGQEFESKDSVDSKFWHSLESEKPVQIQYLKSDPSQNRVAHSPDRVGGYLFTTLGALFFLIGSLCIGYHFKNKRVTNYLLQHGTLTDGRITQVAPGSLSINGVKQWQIIYSFRGLQGGEFTGKTRHMPPEDARVWKTGDKGRVRYDPGKPQRSIWVGKDL